MRNRASGLLLTFVAGALVSLAPISAAAQNQTQPPHTQTTLKFPPILNAGALCPELNGPDPGNKTKERLTALPASVVDPPKTPEGWPDLQGMWSANAYPGTAAHSIEMGVDPIDIAVQCQPKERLNFIRWNILIDPMKGRIPYQPWAKAHQMELLAGIYAPQKRMDTDPEVHCFLLGIPHGPLQGNIGLRYIPGAIVVLADKGTRIIPMDGSPHVGDNVHLFMGDSRGHWEGHTLVIETTNNRDDTWFDKHGTFHSEAMRVTERLTMVTSNTMYYEVTIVDPTVFTQPWKIAQTYDRGRMAGTETPESLCHEGDIAGNSEIERTVRAGLRARAAGIFGYHIHVDLKTGKALDPTDQKYLDQSGQPLGYSFAPAVPDSALPKGFSYMPTPTAPDPKAKSGSAGN